MDPSRQAVQTFRALYPFNADEDDELDLEPGDLIDVAIIHEGEWGVGESRRTQKKGSFPWSYVERLEAQQFHNLQLVDVYQPLVCWHCDDFIWGAGFGQKAYKCTACNFQCHVRCKFFVENNSAIECTPTSNIKGIELKPVDKWSTDDVGLFLVAAHLDEYMPNFKAAGVTGTKLAQIDRKSLQSMGVEDTSHRAMITSCIEELLYGTSKTTDTMFSTRCQHAKSDASDAIQVMDLQPVRDGCNIATKVKGHSFKVKSYSNMQFCDHCRRLLFGLYHQGLQCVDCGFNAHRMCLDQVPICQPNSLAYNTSCNLPGISTGLMFGVPLPSLVNAAQKVPAIVDACLTVLDQPKALQTTNLYLNTAPAAKIRALQATLLQNSMIDLPKKDVILVASLFKRFFLELPDPVFPSSLYNRVVGATTLPTDEEKVQELEKIVGMLDEVHRNTLECLISHLRRVVGQTKSNKVDVDALSKAWSLPLLRPIPTETAKKAADLDGRALAIQLLITRCNCGATEDLPVLSRKKSKKQKAKPGIEAFAQSAYENLVLPTRPTTRQARQPKLPPRPKPAEREKIYESLPINKPQDQSLASQPWFAGKMDRKQSEVVLAGCVDGSFLVRESQSRRGFSLTVKYREIRHVVIVENNGKFGFSEPATFESIEALIKHFENVSLSCYNSELETRLAFPFKQAPKQSNAPADDDYDEGMDEEIYISNVSSLKKSLARQNRDFRYTKAPAAREAHQDKRIKDLQRELKAQQAIMSMLREALDANDRHRQDISEADMSAMQAHYAQIKTRISQVETKEREIAAQLERASEEQASAVLEEQDQPGERRRQSSAAAPPIIPRSTSGNGATSPPPTRQRLMSSTPAVPSVESSRFYMGLYPRDHAEAQLARCPEGTFLIRRSDRPTDPYTLSLVHEGVVKHIVIKYDGTHFGLAEPLAFLTLDSLVKYYSQETLSATIATTLKVPFKDSQ